ncbi:MAG: M56 family metallopeptidase, partial [FCB group bacterium]|nr:M56 family metallopeptidase [FCB group bacterium]
MDALLNIFANEAWTRFTFTLLHTLWQAPLAALALYLLLRFIPAEQPNRRYGAASAALGLVVLAAMVTWSLYRLDTPAPAPAASSTAPTLISHATAAIPASVSTPPVASPSSSWTALVAAAWLAGACAGLLRAVCLLLRAGALRRDASAWDEPAVRESLARLKSVLGMTRRVRVALSDRIDVPGVIGVLRPIVIFPAAVAAGMPPAHLDAILAHELAHIRRYDYWVNLLQLLVEALLFFNPAVWWINRRIRIEREACCDALAASATGFPVAYATALADLAGRLNIGAAQPVLAATGNDDKHVLLDRVKRLLVPGYRPRLGLPWYTLTAL